MTDDLNPHAGETPNDQDPPDPEDGPVDAERTKLPDDELFALRGWVRNELGMELLPLAKGLEELVAISQSLKPAMYKEMEPIKKKVEILTLALKVVRDILKDYDRKIENATQGSVLTGNALLDVDARLTKLETAFANIDERVRSLEETVAELPHSEYLEERFSRIDSRIQNNADYADRELKNVQYNLESRVDRVSNDLNSHSSSYSHSR